MNMHVQAIKFAVDIPVTSLYIIMCRAPYSGWIEAWPYNFVHVHSVLSCKVYANSCITL